MVRFKVKAIPGTINQTIKLWSQTLDSSNIYQYPNDITKIDQELTINDSTYVYHWTLHELTDSTTQIKVHVKDVKNTLINKIKIPFYETDFEKTTKKTLLKFNNRLEYHLSKINFKILGKDSFAGTYCAYVPLKSIQLKKATGMKQNYSMLSGFMASNNIQLNGPPIIEITKWDMNTDSIHYNFCYPIIKSDSLPSHHLIKYKELKPKSAIKAEYIGNYITSDRTWYALSNYAKKNKIKITGKPIEVFHNNPNMGDELNWKTEVYMPIQ